MNSKSLSDQEIIEPAGKGANSLVQKVKKRNSSEFFAMKVIDKTNLKKESSIKRLRREIEIQTALEHQFICKMQDFFEDDSQVYIILEYCEGGELFNHIKGNHVRDTEVRRLFHQLVSAVQFLHSRLIIHRDLKMGNILLDDKGDLKLADFGLSMQLASGEEERETMCGTPNQISPEVVCKQPQGLASDLWALGCIHQAMQVGTPPFEAESVQSTLKKVKSSQFEFPIEVPLEARPIISGLLSSDPARRSNLDQILQSPQFSKININKESNNKNIQTKIDEFDLFQSNNIVPKSFHSNTMKSNEIKHYKYQKNLENTNNYKSTDRQSCNNSPKQRQKSNHEESSSKKRAESYDNKKESIELPFRSISLASTKDDSTKFYNPRQDSNDEPIVNNHYNFRDSLLKDSDVFTSARRNDQDDNKEIELSNENLNPSMNMNQNKQSIPVPINNQLKNNPIKERDLNIPTTNQNQNSSHATPSRHKPQKLDKMDNPHTLAISNSCSKLKVDKKRTAVDEFKETSRFPQLDSYRENKKEEIQQVQPRKPQENQIIPFKLKELNPLKQNSPNGLIEINENRNLIVFIKGRNLYFIVSPCGKVVQIKKILHDGKSAKKAYPLHFLPKKYHSYQEQCRKVLDTIKSKFQQIMMKGQVKYEESATNYEFQMSQDCNYFLNWNEQRVNLVEDQLKVISFQCEQELKQDSEIWKVVQDTKLEKAVVNIIKVFEIMKMMFKKGREGNNSSEIIQDIQL